MKKVLLLTGFLTILNVTLFGQTTAQPHRLHHTGRLTVYQPPQEIPQGMVQIYSSLGTDPKHLYNSLDTWLVAGPNSIFGLPDFIAMPFTPQSNAHVLQVQAAVIWDRSGADQVNFSIHEDHKGHPGKPLAGPVTVTNLPTSPCCQLAVADFSSGVAVKGGTQYWVVADTPKTGQGSDFVGEWAGAVSPVLPLAANTGGAGWVPFSGNGLPAGEVLGTIP